MVGAGVELLNSLSMTIIETFRGVEEISETTYWHLVSGNSSGGFNFLNNARVARGLVHSASYMAELDPNLANVCTDYSYANRENEKERIFEQIRREQFPNLPARLKALFLFQSIELAERAQREWFPNEPRMLVRAWIADGSKMHIADAELLKGSTENWSANAIRYWSGESTSHPFWEVLVHGSIYLPDWESFQLSIPK